MLRNRLYYSVKPLLPARMRVGVRRWFALRKVEKVRDTWPISPGSERPPEGWAGWPDGKKFALVLTHDVETQAGLDKCRRLVELEKSLGFRSSFSLIPEGEYRSTPEFRRELLAEGFEVAVHDFHHDGKLFLTREGFYRNAPRINHYLRDWGAVGFRSGFMLRNMDWLHELDIAYDLSTFDTDPFEPQPQGQNTIFPFWVPRPVGCGQLSVVGSQSPPTAHRLPTTDHSSFSSLHPSALGYVELPYTLPQDSTLFLILGERHPDIWFQKLDWVAQHGGMVLLNVHPDYMEFEGRSAEGRTYPAEFYSRFLEYVRQRYGDVYWQALARDAAAWYRKNAIAKNGVPSSRAARPLRVGMVTYSHYQSDARVTRYAEALAERGDHVDVFALRNAADQPAREQLGGVRVFYPQCRVSKNERSHASFLLPVLRFIWSSALQIAREHSRRPYDLLHVHNVPDFVIFSALYPKLRGAKVILDIHDILPEFYASKFKRTERSIPVLALKLLERLSGTLADHVIIANHLWQPKYAARNHRNGDCSVFINNVDTTAFAPRKRTRTDNKKILIFPGGLQSHQGLDIAIRAFQRVRGEFPEAEFHIYGEGSIKPDLIELARQLGLNESVRFFKPIPVREIAEVIANADLGVVPKRADSFGNEAYSTKIMEFMSVGIPVVVSSTKIDRYYFDDETVRFFQSGDHLALADAILELLRDDSLRRRLVANGLRYANRNSWDSRKPAYLALVDSLIASKPVPSDGSCSAGL